MARSAIVKCGTALVVGAMLAACTGAQSRGSDDVEGSVPEPGEIGAPEESRVTVQGATSAPNMGYLPLYVAQSTDLFEEEGLTVDVQYSHGDAAPLQAIGTGQAQIMSGTPEALIKGYSNGLPGVLFYQVYDEVIFSVGVPTDSDIDKPADLEGTNIGVSSMASTGVVIAEVLVSEAGGDPETLNFVPVGTGQQALGALKAGDVDALALWDTPYAQLESAGVELEYWKPQEIEGAPGGGYFTSWELIEEQPNTLARFTRAMAKSMIAIQESPEEALAVYWEVNPSAKPAGTEEEALEIGLQQLEVVGRSLDLSGEPKEVDLDALDRYAQLLVEHSDAREAPPAKEIATNAFVPIAEEAARAAQGN